MKPILWTEILEITSEHYPDNHLMPVPGNGAVNPKLMLVFINPTSRNISTKKEWAGVRFPFIGCRRPWDIFFKLGWISEQSSNKIKLGNWTEEFAEQVLEELKRSRVYITNLVKNTGQDAALPKAKDIQIYSQILEKEITAVNPEVIVSFGSMVTTALLEKSLRMSDEYAFFKKNKRLSCYQKTIKGNSYKVIPCYYPIGRGEPKKSMEMLQQLTQSPSHVSNVH